MAESSGDKKHPASERRLEQARREGQFPRSTDLTSASLLLAAIAIMKLLGPNLADTLGNYVSESLSGAAPRPFTANDAFHYLLRSGGVFAFAVIPLCATFMLGSIAMQVVQAGWLFLPEKAALNWSHVNPVTGFQRLFSLPNVARIVFGLFKLAIVAWVSYVSLGYLSAEVLGASDLSTTQVARMLIDIVTRICLWIGSALLALAILEYGFQRWKFHQDMMMTDQELREEFKESEGDPQIAARRRQIHRQLAKQLVRKQVPQSDVVITNPTELAIAIKYDPKTMRAPMVMAKGAGLVAQLIRRVALEHEIPVIERKPLAQALYKTVDVGETIPLEQYQAVAEVLRYVYKLQGKPIPRAI